MDEYLVPSGFGEDEFVEKKSRREVTGKNIAERNVQRLHREE